MDANRNPRQTKIHPNPYLLNAKLRATFYRVRLKAYIASGCDLAGTQPAQNMSL